MKKYIFILILFLFAFVPKINAQYYQSGSEDKSIIVDKKVRDAKSDKFFDNISSKDRIFYQNDEIEYKIIVQNNGSKRLDDIYITDFIPSNITVLENPGVLNPSTNVIDWKLDGLNAGESKEYFIKAKIDIKDNKIIDLTNKAAVTVQQVGDQDYATISIGKSTVPNTGSELIVLQSILGLGGIVGAFKLRKYARGY